MGPLFILALGAVFLVVALQVPTPVRADDEPRSSTFASGLDNPRGLFVDDDGTVYVAEAGRGGTTSTANICAFPPFIGPFLGGPSARVSKISRHGHRTTLVAGLPSGQTSPASGSEVLGAEDVLLIGRTPYILLQGGGCSKGNPTQPNAVLRVDPNGSTSQVANLTAFILANPTAGPQDDDRDPEGVPTAFIPARGGFYVLEGNNAQLLHVSHNGVIRRVVDFSLIGQLTYTALAEGPDGALYVGTFSEVPYPDGTARIYRVGEGGQVRLFRTGLTTVIDMKFDCRGRLHVLESSTGNTPQPPFLVPGSGRVRRLVGQQFQTVVDRLTFPTAMAFGPDGDLYISNVGYGQGPNGGRGEIRRVDLNGPGWSSGCHD